MLLKQAARHTRCHTHTQITYNEIKAKHQNRTWQVAFSWFNYFLISKLVMAEGKLVHTQNKSN